MFKTEKFFIHIQKVNGYSLMYNSSHFTDFSNPKVQIGALEEGALQLLIRLVSIHSSTGLRRKVMFCISTLCRHFPFAQKRFLELGGLSAIGKVFEESGTEKLRIKVVAFLNDLLVEKVSLHLFYSSHNMS
jgi:hypothetical protein